MEAPEWILHNLVPGAPADCLVHTCRPAYLQLPPDLNFYAWRQIVSAVQGSQGHQNSWHLPFRSFSICSARDTLHDFQLSQMKDCILKQSISDSPRLFHDANLFVWDSVSGLRAIGTCSLSLRRHSHRPLAKTSDAYGTLIWKHFRSVEVIIGLVELYRIYTHTLTLVNLI